MNLKLSKFIGCGALLLAMCLTNFSCQTTPAANPNDELAELLVNDLMELWNKQNIAILDARHAPDYLRITPNGRINGLDEYKANLQTTFKIWSNINLEIKEHGVVGDKLLMTWKWQGTNVGPLGEGLPATNKTVSFEGMSKVTLENGKVKADRLYWDRLGVNQTVGFTLVPPKVAAPSTEGAPAE